MGAVSRGREGSGGGGPFSEVDFQLVLLRRMADHQPELGRGAPALRVLEDLTHWSCTVDEAARAFSPARLLQGSAPTRWGLAFTASDRHGVRHEVAAEFTRGLLQRVAVSGGRP